MSEVMERRKRGSDHPAPAPDTVRLWFLRHGPVPGAGEGRISGQADLACDLSDQARLDGLRAMLPRDCRFVSSTLRRAQDSGTAVFGSPPEQTFNTLMEQDFGRWTRCLWRDLTDEAQTLGFWDDPVSTAPPGGESFVDQCARVGAWMEEARQTYRGHDVLVACHGGTIRAALAHTLAQASGQPQTSAQADPAQTYAVQARAVLAFVIDTLTLTRIDLFAQGAAIVQVNSAPSVAKDTR